MQLCVQGRGGSTVYLTAQVQPTIAFCLLYSISRLLAKTKVAVEERALSWMRAAIACSTYDYVITAMSNLDQFHAMMNISPLETFNPDQMTCNAVSSESTVLELHKPLLLLTQLLVHLSAKDATKQSSQIKVAEGVGVAKAVARRQMITDPHLPKSLPEEILTEYNQQCVRQSDTDQTRRQHVARLTLLRSAFLLIKLVQLVHHAKINDSDIMLVMKSAVAALTQALVGPDISSSMPQIPSAAEAEQEHQLSLALVQLLMPMMKQYLKAPNQLRTVTPRLFFLVSSLLSGRPDASFQMLASQILDSGAATQLSHGDP